MCFWGLEQWEYPQDDLTCDEEDNEGEEFCCFQSSTRNDVCPQVDANGHVDVGSGRCHFILRASSNCGQNLSSAK